MGSNGIWPIIRHENRLNFNGLLPFFFLFYIKWMKSYELICSVTKPKVCKHQILLLIFLYFNFQPKCPHFQKVSSLCWFKTCSSPHYIASTTTHAHTDTLFNSLFSPSSCRCVTYEVQQWLWNPVMRKAAEVKHVCGWIQPQLVQQMFLWNSLNNFTPVFPVSVSVWTAGSDYISFSSKNVLEIDEH